MSGSPANLWAILLLTGAPGPVATAYIAFGAVLATGLAVIFLRGHWKKARRFDRLILLGPLFYAAPVAGFGTEHFTTTRVIASLVPLWIPWHEFWAYFVGACFIAAGVSLATRIEWRPASGMLALTFFLFVALMDAPGWARDPHNRFAAALMLRELSFSGGALALASSLSGKWRGAAVARYFIAVPVLFYSLEQFLHGNYVPGIPLDRLTPEWVFGHAFWTYLAAAVYAVAGALLLAGWRTRSAATWLGLTVLVVELAVYAPIAVADRATLVGFNYMADTLMFCGAVLLLAGAMPGTGAGVGTKKHTRHAFIAEGPPHLLGEPAQPQKQ